jgi:protein TonB
MASTFMNTDREPIAFELKDDLARLCLPEANQDPNRVLAWVNSICLLFLLIGIIGVKPAQISIPPVPTLEEVVPLIVEQAPPPPQLINPDTKQEEENDENKSDAPQVVVVTPESPSVNFSVPTIGTLVVPNALAAPPPLKPLASPTVVEDRSSLPGALNTTGSGGERPQPTYPKIALDQAEQGTVRLLMTADEQGKILSVELKASSGYPILDRSTLDFVRRHWHLPAGPGKRLYETSITYRLSAG